MILDGHLVSEENNKVLYTGYTYTVHIYCKSKITVFLSIPIRLSSIFMNIDLLKAKKKNHYSLGNVNEFL